MKKFTGNFSKHMKDWGGKPKVSLTMPPDMIIELNPQFGPEEYKTVPVLIKGSEIQIDVTDLMSPSQAQIFSDRFAEACNDAAIKRIVDGNFGIMRND